MIKINFKEPTDDLDWAAWRKECEVETKNFIAHVEKLRANQPSVYEVKNLYKKDIIRKKYFFSDKFEGPFYRKCAYCEESIASMDGDVEHFRPKNRVSDVNFEILKDHYGYYWLAYHWENLLPSCQKCNQTRLWDVIPMPVKLGKQDRFPLIDETTRVSHHDGNIHAEKAYLIHPYFDDPEEHLDVDISTGIMLSKSERGRFCIDFFGLNIREDLVDGRVKAAMQAYSICDDILSTSRENNPQKMVTLYSNLLTLVNGKKRFSLPVRVFLKKYYGDNYLQRIEEQIVRFKQQLN